MKVLKGLVKLLFHRVVIVGVAILLQAAYFIILLSKFQEFFAFSYGILMLLSVAVVLHLLNDRSNPAYKLAWIIPILIFPIFGGLFYVIFGHSHLSKKQKEEMREIARQISSVMPDRTPNLDRLKEENPVAGLQAQYIYHFAYAPLCRNTYTEYLPLGEIKFERMKEELRKAKHYIFLEYFIIEEGKMWNEILEILQEKVAAGVDVRVIYDDIGSMMTLPYGYDRKLEAMGIKCCVFNPLVPILSIRFNNRDHRKICVIDGWVGFTGGINLADEYINAIVKHGHWKDTAVLLKGDGVWNLTVMFLSLWDFLRHTQDHYEAFRPHVHQPEPIPSQGYVQPFGDIPLDNEAVGETVYLNLITKAQRYVHITSPYLIIDNEMVTALSNAAKSGVDVRIITPHIADKFYVHAVTRAYYETLLEAGVRIFEYTPGFIHAKTFVVDDEYAVVGTINLDYRSLYLHFECGCWMYKTPSVEQVKKDFLKTQEKSQEMTLASVRKLHWFQRLGRSVLRVFAPLM